MRREWAKGKLKTSKLFWSILIVGTSIILLYSYVMRQFQERGLQSIFEITVNVKENQLRLNVDLLNNNVEMQAQSYTEELFDTLKEAKDLVKSELEDASGTLQIRDVLSSYSTIYQEFEFSLWDQNEIKLESNDIKMIAAYQGGSSTVLTTEFNSYLLNGQYELIHVEGTNQLIVIKVEQKIVTERFKQALIEEINQINELGAYFSLIDLNLPDDSTTVNDYFGTIITAPESSEYNYREYQNLSKNQRDKDGRFLFQEIEKGIYKNKEHFGMYHIDGPNGDGYYLFYTRWYPEFNCLIFATAHSEQLRDETVNFIQNYERDSHYYIVGMTVITIAAIAVAFISATMLLEVSKKKQIEAEKERANQVLSHHALIFSKYERINELVHDMKNHLISIKGLIGTEKKHPANDYIDSVHRDLNQLSNTVITGNQVVDVILNDKISRMKECNITLDKKIEKISLDFMDPKDVTILLANLLDNAIENSAVGDSKYIYFQLTLFNDSYVVIKVINSCEQRPVVEKGKLISQKQKELCGYGVKNIERIVNQYNGMSKWEYNDELQQFHFTVTIPKVDLKK